MILRCEKRCKHEFQDKRYGKGLRVHNIKADKLRATCTVCGNERPIRGS